MYKVASRLTDEGKKSLPCECVCSTSSPTVSTIVYPLRSVVAAMARTSLENVALKSNVCRAADHHKQR